MIKMDKEKTINELKNNISIFMEQRGWNKSSPINLAISISLESSELLEIFQWDNNVLSEKNIMFDKDRMNNIKQEMADILIYTLSLSERLGIDTSDIVEEKLAYNSQKYPVKYFNTKNQNPDYYKKIKKLYRLKNKFK